MHRRGLGIARGLAASPLDEAPGPRGPRAEERDAVAVFLALGAAAERRLAAGGLDEALRSRLGSAREAALRAVSSRGGDRRRQVLALDARLRDAMRAGDGAGPSRGTAAGRRAGRARDPLAGAFVPARERRLS